MSVRVYNKEAFESLREHALGQSPTKKHIQQSQRSDLPTTESLSSSSGHVYSKAEAERLQRRHQKYQEEQASLEKRVAHETAENIRKAQSRRDAYYLKLCHDLEDADKLSQELKDRIDLKDASDERKRQKMFLEWTEQVYDKINGPINASLDQIGKKELNRRRREAYQTFLDTSNKKGALFRDIILESEYNPLADNPPIRSKCASLDDPCSRVLIRRKQEEDIANRGKPAIRKVPNGRTDNLDAQLWASGVIESTPHGYFNKLMNSTASEKSTKTHRSRVKFDHYNIEKGVDVLNAELPRGKRTHFDFEVKAYTSKVNFG